MLEVRGPEDKLPDGSTSPPLPPRTYLAHADSPHSSSQSHAGEDTVSGRDLNHKSQIAISLTDASRDHRQENGELNTGEQPR